MSHQYSPKTNTVLDAPAGGIPASRAGSIDKPYVDEVEDAEKSIDPNTKADQFGTSTTYTALEKKLLKKLDWHILPIVWAMYFMNKLDQNAIANARLNRLEKDIGLTGNQFNVCVSVLYVSDSYVSQLTVGGVHFDPNSFEHVDVNQACSTISLDGWLDGVSTVMLVYLHS